MKKFFMISVLMGALPLSMVAQDDLYFVPKKKSAEVVEVTTPINNRVKSQYEVIANDSTSDIIAFDGEKGIYPDSIITEDYELTKRMQRFEDYDLSDNAAFWAGYHLGRDTWNWGLSWHSPWYYTRYGWYGGWYDPWYYSYSIYDPWYYGGYYGWYDPWRFGYYDPWYYSWYGGWYDPWYYGYYGYYGWTYPRHYYYADVYYGGRPHYATNGTTGTQHHGRIDYSGSRGISNGRTTTHSAGTFGGSAIAGKRTNTSTRTTTAQGSTQRTVVRNSSGNFGGNRSNSSIYTNSNSSNSSTNRSGSFSSSSTRSSTVSSSSSSSMSSSSGGSFGGSRSSGGTIGGSRSGGGGGGGGGFGGGRRR